MSMIWRDPSDTFLPLRQAMDRLLEGSFLWPGRFDLFTGQSFPIDLYESNDHQQYIVEATVPGFKPEEIQITAQGVSLRSMPPKSRSRSRRRVDTCAESATRAR